jgi:DNA-directed RNA polymerase alpha subunit
VSVEKFCNNFKIDIKRLTKDDMEFDMIGVDASIANAFRRILISEVFACCHVFHEITKNCSLFWNN